MGKMGVTFRRNAVPKVIISSLPSSSTRDTNLHTQIVFDLTKQKMIPSVDSRINIFCCKPLNYMRFELLISTIVCHIDLKILAVDIIAVFLFL